VLSVTPPLESFSIQSPSSAEHAHLAPNSIQLLNHANVNVILQEASIQPQSNVNVLEEEFGSTTNANALMPNHSGMVRTVLHAHLEPTLNQKISNATTAQKDLLLIQSLIIAHQDFESSTDSCSFVFL
jgi:hypothetical protein